MTGSTQEKKAAVYFPRIPSGGPPPDVRADSGARNGGVLLGAGSQTWLSGLSGRESGQPGGGGGEGEGLVGGWWGGRGGTSGFISQCRPKLVFPEQKCQLSFCLQLDSPAGRLLVPPPSSLLPPTHTHTNKHAPVHPRPRARCSL